MNTKVENIKILMLPWLAHGHISPFFELAKKLALRNFHVYFCSTPINLKPIREISFDKTSPLIELVEIYLPPSFQELPPHYHTTKDLPPYLLSTLRTAFDEARPFFCNLLKNLKPDLVIYDFLQPWVPESAYEHLNIKSVLFLTCGAATSSFLHRCCISSSTNFPIKELNVSESESQKILQFMHDIANGVTNSYTYLECIRRSCSIVLIKTSIEIEAKYIDYLSDLTGKEMVTVGPLIQEPAHKDDDDDDDDADIMKWLSEKESGSVVYVSFGSQCFLSKEEIQEIAHGLELSNANFIWVVRFHGGENMTLIEALPDGFLRRVEERGLVVQGWAPQAKILQHSSIRGFVSHCGWSSTLEGIVFGVPIIAMPIQLDQPLNAKLVVEIGAGKEVPRKNEKLDGEEIARVINEVVLENKEADEQVIMRKRAKELSERLKETGDQELDLAVEKLLHFITEI